MVAVFALLPGLVLQAGNPSAVSLLTSCQRAYDSAKSFEQESVGKTEGQTATAHVWFSRPGKLRVSGRSMFGAAYDLLCDGRATWLSTSGSWSKLKDAESGIASITGITLNAGTISPAMLMHSAWGSLSPATVKGATVRAVSLGGRKAWRIDSKKPYPSSLWIDAGSLFVMRTETKFMGHLMTVDLKPPKVNVAVPAERFRK